MPKITIELSEALYGELKTASAAVREHGFNAESWAAEAVESALAARRLPHVTPSKLPARPVKLAERELYPEELDYYRLHLPDMEPCA